MEKPGKPIVSFELGLSDQEPDDFLIMKGSLADGEHIARIIQ
jgi:hypothetical protein